METKIIVATHKKYMMPVDSLYLPVHVGRAGKADLGYVGDNTGENISEKNTYYCELTGLYWAWKNIKCDAIGLVHYRRYFGKHSKKEFFNSIITKTEIDLLLSKYDMILPPKRNYRIETIEQHFKEHMKVFTSIKYMDYLRQAIEEVAPEYSDALEKSLMKKEGHKWNMFIMKEEVFNKYCTWLFSVLAHLEDNHVNYTAEKQLERIYGFLGEILLDVWIGYNGLTFVEVDVVLAEPEKKIKKTFEFCKRKFLGIK